jgi:16S rRNA (guanine(966)-N(2))-methyltransferase RsmD
MRIIRGKFKGRHITPPNNITARPTTDFAKEGLFNMLDLELDYEEICALDLFTGCGSISFELVSRGCQKVTGIEQSPVQIGFIKKTIEQLKITEFSIIKADVFKYINSTSAQFDFIFADPPYELPTLAEIPDLIFQNNLLADDGLFILEHSKKNNFESHPNFEKERNYGNVHFSFFRKK